MYIMKSNVSEPQPASVELQVVPYQVALHRTAAVRPRLREASNERLLMPAEVANHAVETYGTREDR
jgi:hypothetical protein